MEDGGRGVGHPGSISPWWGGAGRPGHLEDVHGRESRRSGANQTDKSGKIKEGPKGQKLENGAGPGAAKFFVWEIGKTGYFWQLVGGGTPEADPQRGKMQGSQGPQGKNKRK